MTDDFYKGGIFREFKTHIFCPKPEIDEYNVGVKKRKVTGWQNTLYCENCDHLVDTNLDNLGIWCAYPTKKLQKELSKQPKETPRK